MKLGKFYKYKDGTVILCTDEDLETFSGVIVKVSRKKKAAKAYPLGHFADNWDSDFKPAPKKLKIKLKL